MQLSAADVLRRVNEELVSRRLRAGTSALLALAPPTTPVPEGDLGAEWRTRLLEPPVAIKRSYDLAELVGSHDRAFVRNVYRALLGREPDAASEEFVLALRRQRLNKVEVVQAVASSPEARARCVEVRGLDAKVRRNRLARLFKDRIRGLRFLVKGLLAAARLPRLQSMLEGLELTLHAQNADRIEALGAALDRLRAELRATEQAHAQSSANAAQEVANRVHSQVEVRLATFESATRARWSECAAETEAALTAVRTSLETLEQQGQRTAAEQRQSLEAHARTMQSTCDAVVTVERMTTGHQLILADQQKRLQFLIDEVKQRLDGLPPSAHPDEAKNADLAAVVAEGEHLRDMTYVILEDRFRGARADIKGRLEVYLPKVSAVVRDQAAERLLDLGCGRGEWLELMRAQGYAATGVDLSDAMVAECSSRGLRAAQGDTVGQLRTFADASISVVSAFHLVEHLENHDLVYLLDEVLRVLRPGGMVILETPNPENVVVGSCNFYLDPTHKRPLPPALLQHLVESRGLVRSEVMRLHPARFVDVPEDGPLGPIAYRFNVAQDYSIVAYRA